MKKFKRFAGRLLAVLAVLFLPMQAMAADPVHTSQDLSLTVSYADKGVPLSGAEFSLYLVATMDENGELTTTDAFSQFDVNIHGENDDAWRALTSTMAAYAVKTTPIDTGTTNREGQLTFPTSGKTLSRGLYLVLGARHSQGGMIYDAQPFLALLPTFDKDTSAWLNNVTAKPKHESHPEPQEDDTVSRRVLKVWKDEGHETERPQEVTVQLYRNGVAYDTVTLNAAKGWGYTWSDLDASYTWTVTETVPEGYTVQITQEGNTFVVVNTYPPEKPTPTPTPSPNPSESPTPPPDNSNDAPPSDAPETSNPPDSQNPPNQPILPQTGQLWWPVPLLVTLGLCFLLVGLLRRRNSGSER